MQRSEAYTPFQAEPSRTIAIVIIIHKAQILHEVDCRKCFIYHQVKIRRIPLSSTQLPLLTTLREYNVVGSR